MLVSASSCVLAEASAGPGCFVSCCRPSLRGVTQHKRCRRCRFLPDLGVQVLRNCTLLRLICLCLSLQRGFCFSKACQDRRCTRRSRASQSILSSSCCELQPLVDVGRCLVFQALEALTCLIVMFFLHGPLYYHRANVMLTCYITAAWCMLHSCV